MNEKEKPTENFKEIWDLAGSYRYDAEASNEEAWNQLQGQIAQQKPALRFWKRPAVWAAAASVAIVATWGVAMLSRKSQELHPSQQYATQIGQRQTITLEDGSTITLNAGSSVKIAKGYGQEHRNIELSGEAWFEVAKNEKLPFVVSAENTKTTVLGTGFDIKARKGEGQVTITVLHGKVKFENPIGALTLEKNMAARATQNGIEPIDGDTTAVSWAKGKMEFKSSSLEELSRTVKYQYGKTLVYDPKFKDRKFTGTFEAGTPVKEIADIVAAALQIPVTVE